MALCSHLFGFIFCKNYTLECDIYTSNHESWNYIKSGSLLFERIPSHYSLLLDRQWKKSHCVRWAVILSLKQRKPSYWWMNECVSDTSRVQWLQQKINNVLNIICFAFIECMLISCVVEWCNIWQYLFLHNQPIIHKHFKQKIYQPGNIVISFEPF